MDTDHVLTAVAAFVGGFAAQLSIVPVLRKHAIALYKGLNEVRAKLDLSPIPFKVSDLDPEPISGVFRKP